MLWAQKAGTYVADGLRRRPISNGSAAGSDLFSY